MIYVQTFNTYLPGTPDPENPGECCDPVPLSEALTTKYTYENNFVAYFLADNQPKPIPRYRKPALPKLRALRKDAGLCMELMVFDWDLPGHVSWESEEQALATVGEFLGKSPWPPLGVYTSPGGIRLIYRLSRPLPVDDAEDVHRGMIAALAEADIHVDQRCSDWTRIYKLPHIQRKDNKGVDWEPFVAYDPEAPSVPLETLRRIPKEDNTRLAGSLDAPQPEDDEARSLLYEMGTNGKELSTPFLKHCKRALRDKPYYNALFEGAPLATRGSRNETIHKTVWSITSSLWTRPDLTPEHVYALLLDASERMEPDAGKPWSHEVWRSVCQAWPEQEAQEALRKKEEKREALEALDQVERMRLGALEWVDCPVSQEILSEKGQPAEEWIRRRLIASVGRHYYIMKPNGYYSAIPCSKDQLLGRLVETRAEALIDMERDANGRMVDTPIAHILKRHQIVLTGVQGRPGTWKGAIIRGRLVQGEDGREGQGRTMVTSIGYRNPDLVPEFNADVDEWLTRFFRDDPTLGKKWIGHALAVEEGNITGLSLVGPKSAGKKLLVWGLAEALEPFHPPATGEDLVEQFTPGLGKSLLVNVNETWPDFRYSKRSPSGVYRSLITGDGYHTNEKYMPSMFVQAGARVILTANNRDVVVALSGDRDLSEDDREALHLRILHFEIGHESKEWLESKGGMKFTKGWIRPDGGEGNSDYVVAKHFLWLYENRGEPVSKSGRLLVDGGNCPEIIQEMRVRSGSSPLVREIVIRLIEKKGRGHLRSDGVKEQDGEIYITSASVLDFFRDEMAGSTGERLNEAKIGKVLKSLGRRTRTRVEGERKTWYRVDLESLLDTAEESGRDAPYLTRLVRGEVVDLERERKKETG